MGPTNKIAELLNMSSREVIAYCEEVRSISGLGAELQYKTIAQHLAQNPGESPSPQKMAEIVRANKLVLPPKQVKSKKVKRPLPTRPVRWNISKALKRNERYRPPERAKSTSLPKNVTRGSFFDHERVSEDQLKHCPHGVAQGRICAICAPHNAKDRQPPKPRRATG